MKNKYLILPVIISLLLISAVFAGCGNRRNPPVVVPGPGGEEPPPQQPAGQEKPVWERVEPVAVVIDNQAAAKPHSGLQQAARVYEFLVEGGTTRFLAVFDRPLTEDFRIGPIRSLRRYFAEQAMEHGGIVAHSGHSERTKDEIKPLGLRQITSSDYLFRDNSRKAPHNLYTSLARLYKARGDSQVIKEAVEVSVTNVPFTEGYNLEVVYSANNRVSYVYDDDDNAYLRSVNGRPHTDRETGRQYAAARVIVRKNKHANVVGTVYVDIDLSGSGSAILYEGGRQYPLRWENRDGLTRYFYEDGSEVDLRLGNTWVQVVR